MDISPTAIAEGVRTRRCAACGEEERSSIPKLNPTIRLNARSIPLRIGQSTTKVKVGGLAAGDKVKSWRSGSPKIVKVTNSGKITAQKKTGTATLTVTLLSGKKSTVRVKVQKGEVKTKKITGLPKKAVLKVGKKLALKPVLSPITSSQKLEYSTSNKKAASVSRKGVVAARKAGRAKVTVRSGKKKSVVSVIIKK